MENASKALIIAGAILISIVLITLGVVIVQQGGDVTNNQKAAMDSQEISTFNNRFTQYEGTSVPGSNVRSLLTAVRSSNAAETNNGGGHIITLAGNATNSQTILPAHRYNVLCEDTDNNGYIDTITINQ